MMKHCSLHPLILRFLPFLPSVDTERLTIALVWIFANNIIEDVAMNRLQPVSIISFCLLILTGCLHSDKDKNNTNHSVRTEPTTAVVTNNTGNTGNTGNDDKQDDKGNVSTPSTPSTPSIDVVICEATPEPINKFIRVQTTYGLLDEGAFIPGESGGLLPLTLTAPALQGETVINVDSAIPLVDKQLLTYLGTNGEYSVGKVKSTTDNTITLEEPLLFDLAADDNSLWNFYDDAVHANNNGFRALADFGFNTALDVLEPNKVHALLGDSWFRRNGETPFADRLLERLPSGSVIQNEGIGGHSLCGLLARVDNVIDTYNPNYVWINSSINDSFDEVTQEQYKARMQTLISKIQEAGAIAIVMDPAPGILTQSTSDGVTFTTLSRRYASQILDLLAEAAD